jgi:hypothetical protein
MTHDENDSGWDSLADELGIEPAKLPETSERPAEPTRLKPARPVRDPRPEIEQEMDDFGAGVTEEPESMAEAAMYDPGAGAIVEEEEFEETVEELYEDAEEGYAPPGAEGEGQDGGKRRRRRRRRKKKGGPEDEAGAAAPPSEFAETDEVVEEGEAPGEVEDDDEPSGPMPAMEEELEEEVVRARPDWHVMTWAELVSKLYRPG